jgi:hypothetical protein
MTAPPGSANSTRRSNEAGRNGWTVIDMKDDCNRIYSFDAVAAKTP